MTRHKASFITRQKTDDLSNIFWVAKTPDLADWDSVLGYATKFPAKVGYHLGTLVGCRELGACPDTGEVATWCERRVKTVTVSPQKCQQPGGPTLSGWAP